MLVRFLLKFRVTKHRYALDLIFIYNGFKTSLQFAQFYDFTFIENVL